MTERDRGSDGGMSLTLLKACGEFDSKIMQFAEIIKRQNGLVPGLKPSTSREHTQSVLYLKGQLYCVACA